MSPSVFVRLSGALLVLGGLAGAAVPLAHPRHGPAYYADPMTAPVHLVLFVAVLLVSLGLPGLVAAQPEPLRPWAGLAAALVFVGEWLLDGTHGIVDGAVLPALVQHHAAGADVARVVERGPLGTLTSVGVPVMILGCLALGAVLFRGRAVPRPAALLVALCWVLVPVSFVVPAVRGMDVALPYVALAWAGGALMRRRATGRAPTGRAAPRSAPAHAPAALPTH